jgi:hypothetical protein
MFGQVFVRSERYSQNSINAAFLERHPIYLHLSAAVQIFWFPERRGRDDVGDGRH